MRKPGVLLAVTALLGAAVTLAEEPAEPVYFELKPSLVTNLNGGPDYIRCDVQLMTRQADRIPDLALHAPALRHELLLLLVEQDGAGLLTPAGKGALRKRALEALRQVLKAKAGDELVEDLYFTSYYVK